MSSPQITRMFGCSASATDSSSSRIGSSRSVASAPAVVPHPDGVIGPCPLRRRAGRTFDADVRQAAAAGTVLAGASRRLHPRSSGPGPRSSRGSRYRRHRRAHDRRGAVWALSWSRWTLMRIDPHKNVIAVSKVAVWIAGDHCGSVIGRSIRARTADGPPDQRQRVPHQHRSRLRLALGVGPRCEVDPARRSTDSQDHRHPAGRRDSGTPDRRARSRVGPPRHRVRPSNRTAALTPRPRQDRHSPPLRQSRAHTLEPHAEDWAA